MFPSRTIDSDSMTAAIMQRLPFLFKTQFLASPNERKSRKTSKKKTTLTYLILTAAFVVIFGGIILLGIFIAHLST